MALLLGSVVIMSCRSVLMYTLIVDASKHPLVIYESIAHRLVNLHLALIDSKCHQYPCLINVSTNKTDCTLIEYGASRPNFQLHCRLIYHIPERPGQGARFEISAATMLAMVVDTSSMPVSNRICLSARLSSGSRLSRLQYV